MQAFDILLIVNGLLALVALVSTIKDRRALNKLEVKKP